MELNPTAETINQNTQRGNEMNFRIWIKTDKHGTPGVGADSITDDEVVCAEKIFPSQMAHRVTAAMNDRHGDGTRQIVICTPTEARANGWQIIAHYPRANGAFKRQ